MRNEKKTNKIDELVTELKGCKEGSVKWNMLYSDIFMELNGIGERFLNSKLANKQRAVRIDIGDMHSLIGQAVMDVVKSFDVNKNKGFDKLFIYRLNQLMLNKIKSMSSFKNKSLTVSDDVEAKAELDNERANKDVYGASVDKYAFDKEVTLFDILEEYIEINPKARIFNYFHLPAEARTEHILKILGSDTYGGKERKAVYDIRKRFMQFCKEKNYRVV